MTTPSTASPPQHRGTLDDFLPADEIVPLPELAEGDWNVIRQDAGRRLAWRFCTLRNLVAYRGRFAFDAMGFAWGGIYRTLLVSSIVTTSFRNEGHFRAGERIGGTSDFFSGAFAFPRSSAEFREIIGMVNLRHHVAGVVSPAGEGQVRVVPGYEADYAYVATAFIESIRRGLSLAGLAPESPAGRALAEQVSTILYQLVGTLLDDTAARSGSRQLASIAQLFRFLTGDSHVSLDAVIDLPVDATPDECVEALRRQVDEAIRGGGLPPELERYLANVVATIG